MATKCLVLLSEVTRVTRLLVVKRPVNLSCVVKNITLDCNFRYGSVYFLDTTADLTLLLDSADKFIGHSVLLDG